MLIAMKGGGEMGVGGEVFQSGCLFYVVCFCFPHYEIFAFVLKLKIDSFRY